MTEKETDMAKLTDKRDTDRRDGVLWTVEMDRMPQTIHKGGLVNLNKDRYAVSASDTEDHIFIGVAYESKECHACDRDDGDTEIRVFRKGVFLFDSAVPPARDMIGMEVVVVDDQTVGIHIMDSHVILCGRIVGVEKNVTPDAIGTYYNAVWIDIEGYAPAA